MYFLETPLTVNELKNGEEHFVYDDATQTEFLKKIEVVSRRYIETNDLELSRVTILEPRNTKTDSVSNHRWVHLFERHIKQLMGDDAARRGFFTTLKGEKI